MLSVLPLDLAPVWQREDIGTFPFNQHSALVGRRHMAHELGIAKPTIGHDHRWGQCHAASAERCHASIQHALDPVQFVTARSTRAWRVGTTDRKVDGDDQLAFANDHDKQPTINAREYPVFLAAPPGAHQAQLVTILFEYRVIGDPGPLPATARGFTLASGIAPQRDQHLQAQTSEALEPGALGQCTE